MIVECIALLMFVNGEIKEARLQPEGMAKCIRGKLTAERQYSETVSYKCYKGKQKVIKNKKSYDRKKYNKSASRNS